MRISFYNISAVRYWYACARVIAGLLALCCTAPAWGAPSIVTSTSFTAADGARSYMDSGGVWNGSVEVTNTTGDTFSITLRNNAAGLPNPLVNDVAFDIELTLNVPAGFRLPVSPFTVNTSATGGDTNCNAPGGSSITATQAGGTGAPITFNFPANTNLPGQGAGASGCRYTLSFGLTTSNAAPFVASGTHTLNYSFRYNTIDGSAASQQTANAGQNIAVRRGDVIVTKTAVPNPAEPDGGYADGETAEWTVSVFNNGTGGTFAVEVTDTPNANFDAATLQLTPPGPPPGVNQYTLSYLAPGEQADITVEAQIEVPTTAGSCPDLRNDVSVEDRLGNTSTAFASVVLDLQDPLLDYAPPNFTIDFGTPETVSFTVSNTGSGEARNVRLQVSGLNGVTISNVSAEWTYDTPSSTFIHVGPIPAGGSSQLQFDAEVDSCLGPNGGFLSWSPQYENICGQVFTTPVDSSTYTVANFPNLDVAKSVTPSASNFGVPGAFYIIDLTNLVNVGGLGAEPGTNDDWEVNDTLPDGVSNGRITAIPAGTTIEVNGSVETVTPILFGAGDTITWRGDGEDLSPLPSLRIDFDVTSDCIQFSPQLPPITFTNTARLDYPSCGILGEPASAQMVINDSPASTEDQALVLVNASNAPFETGRPDTDLAPGTEPNEGERITFRATYEFDDAPYTGVWNTSLFRARMGTGILAEPLQLSFMDAGGTPDQPDAGESTSVTIVVTDSGGNDFTFANLPVGSGSGQVNFDSNGFVIDLSFVEAAIGGIPSMAGTTLEITYHVTAPEGDLGPDLQPLNDDNIAGILDERVTLRVASDFSSCALSEDFIQGVGVELARADLMVMFADIEETNDAGACGVTTANLGIFGPSSGLSADNIRILLHSTDYELPDVQGDFTFNPSDGDPDTGDLDELNKAFDFTNLPDDVVIEVTPNVQNLAGNLSTVSFPVTLRSGFLARDLQATVFFDSNHTSPDFDGDAVEAYNTGPVSFFVPTPTASLDVQFFPPSVILGDPAMFADVDPGIPGLEGVFTWQVRITNTGTNAVTDYVFTNEVPLGFLPYRAGSSPQALPGALTDRLMVWDSDDLGPLPPGGFVELIVAIGLAQNAGCNAGPGTQNETSVRFGCLSGTELDTDSGPTIDFPVIDLVLEHRDTSYCELCREGTVELEVRNEGASDLYSLLITEELAGSGLEYVPGSGFVTFEGGTPIALEPVISGSQLIWDSSNLGGLISSLRPGEPHLFSDLNGTPSELVLSFDLQSSNANPEELLNASRQITASAQFNLFCGDPNLAPVVENFTVPLHQPQPTVDKQGRNFSARQDDTQYSSPVFGGTDDVLVWRVDVQNSGITSSADLEDLLVNDTIGGNFFLRYICPTAAAADAMAAALETTLFAPAAAPAPVAPCVAYAPSLVVDDPFGSPGAPIDVPEGESAFIYYVGEVDNLCTNEFNSANIEWGCELGGSPPPGGINASTPGVVGAIDNDSASMSTAVNSGGVVITQTVTGVNPAQPVGTRGIVTLTITNNSGGTVRGLVLTDIVPADYEIDLSSLNPPNTPLTVNAAFGTYPGIIDGVDTDTSDPTTPVFDFTSSTQGTVNQSELLRNGDQLILTFQIIRVRPFDDVNDPEVREESPATVPPTDPAYAVTGTNTVSLQFDDTCDANPALPGLPRVDDLDVDIDPEDIDVDINPTDPNLLYILSDPTATQVMSVVVTNNGGHDAANYDTWVTIGNGIEIVGALPAGCAGPVAPPPQLGAPPGNPAGILPPEYDPADSLTYRCVTRDPLPPGQADTFNFTVQRAILSGSGDLTFRADVLGESALSDGSLPPDRGAAGYPYYSKDNILARIIGFNLRKALNGNCSEDNPPPVDNDRVLIGEECTLRIEAEWFGFATPGFGNVEIRNARIYEGQAGGPPPVEGDPAGTPNLPTALDGQGLVGISFNNTAAVSVAEQNPPALAPLAETGLAWRLNNIIAVMGNTEESFIADLRFRTLNDPVNTSAAPNMHAALQTDELNARFEVFFTATGETFIFDENSAGYPPQAMRQESLRIIEPQLSLTKAVCNESVSVAGNPANSGANCTPFVSLPTILTGDTNDTFIYRLRASNENTSGGFQRAPAFDVTIDDAMDISDRLIPFDFTADGLDNDGDGLVDGADTDGEGTVDDFVPVNGNAADINFSGAHSSALAQIDPGATVTLLYRARPDASVTPGQQFNNTADGGYDSLPGVSGSQLAPQGASGALTGAREYNIPQVQASVRIDNVVAPPGTKEFINTSRRDAGLVAGACASPCTAEDVVIGEEVLVELEVVLPLSQLQQLSVQDNLPPGMECIEAEPISLPALPANPGFNPGGVFPAAVCNATQVRWDLGDQDLQGGEYTLRARFIARVTNIAANQEGTAIINGGGTAGGGTEVFASYRDAGNALQTIAIGAATLTVREPDLSVTKNMEPVVPNVSVDAVDRINVTVVLENTSSVPAYNIQLLDTLDPNLSFVAGSAGGANPPDSVDLTVPSTPRFVFNAPLPAGSSFTFTYQVQVDSDVRPLEVLNNTINARFTSLPANTVALNTVTGDIGADGAANGMRTGFLPPLAGTDTLNDYEAEGGDSETVPALTIIKTDLDPTVVPTIGARKHFQIIIGLPESIADAVVVNDNLGAGDTSFVLENDASFDITYTFQNIVSINSSAVAGFTTPDDVEAALAAFTAVDEATGVVTWNFGTVVTENEDDASGVNNVNPQIVIDYYARIANEPATVDGANLLNAANVDDSDPAPPVVAPPVGPFPVLEPELRVVKDYTGTGTVVQGSAVPFEIQVINDGGATAWDTTIVDMLPNRTDQGDAGGMCGGAPTITGIAVNGRILTEGTDYTFTFVPAASAADLYCSFTLVLTPTAVTNDAARIETGETLSITYEATLDVDVSNGSTLTDVAGATQWFSQDTDGVTVPPETRQYDRTLTLAPDPDPGTTAIDDHQDAATVQTQISRPGFVFEKISTDVTGSATVLASGDTLRYTITINNVGDPPSPTAADAQNVVFHDQIPAHTRYVANSTRLNGSPVADAGAGVPPFANGMPVNSPGEIPGFMRLNVPATVSFDVRINNNLVNGTVISNQGLLTGERVPVAPATPVPFPAAVSDDPGTPLVDDPTQDTVGSGVNIDAQKIVRFATEDEDNNPGNPGEDGDLDDDGLVDPGDLLRYIVIIRNGGTADAGTVIFTDTLPAEVTYLADTTELDGVSLPPDGGLAQFAPAQGGLSIPLPARSNATVEFTVAVNAGVPGGTLIVNQGEVTSAQQPLEPTDADGNDENGDQPTVVVVDGAAQLEITKEVVVVGGGTARAGGELEYRIRVENISDVAADQVVVTDIMPDDTVYIDDSGRINGSQTGVTEPVAPANVLTADYTTAYGPLAPRDSFVLTFRVTIDTDVLPGVTISNTADLTWNGGSDSDSAIVDIGGAPGVINLNGNVWDNRLHDDAFDPPGEPGLPGWRVRVYVNNPNPSSADAPLAETATDASGLYRFTGLAPVEPGDPDGAYTITFSPPAGFPAGAEVALGDAESELGVEGLMVINNLNVPAGRNALRENLPVDPMGVVYSSVTRQPVQGARVTLLDSGRNPVPGACFATPDHLDTQQGQITSALGFYRFDLNFSGGACPPAGADYVIQVEVPDSAGNFAVNESADIPPDPSTLDVVACTTDPALDQVASPPAGTCEVQGQATAPGPSMATRYFLNVTLRNSPEELFNNHIPVDMDAGGILAITKRTPLRNVTRGQLVPYTITVTNGQNFPVNGLEIRDFFPPGFKYVRGSAVIDGQPDEPVADASSFNDDNLRAGTLSWSDLSLQPGDTLTLKLLLVVGSGVGEGEYTNQAQAFIDVSPEPVSGRASATVRVVSDPTFDCSDIIGKVYDDRNANGYPDQDEPGIAGARIVTAQGLLSTTDKYGRFHITCAAVPNPDRGSNFILKLDERSLPSGYRVTTENPRVHRLTRGKIAKFNFGVTLHRVVRLDLADQAFEFGGAGIQEHWRFVLDDLLAQLREKPSILRITYLVESESEALAKQRLEAVQEWITAHWQELKCCYDLKVETELFWRTGSPE